jgi:hypothetical protein
VRTPFSMNRSFYVIREDFDINKSNDKTDNNGSKSNIMHNLFNYRHLPKLYAFNLKLSGNELYDSINIKGSDNLNL